MYSIFGTFQMLRLNFELLFKAALCEIISKEKFLWISACFSQAKGFTISVGAI